MTHPWTQVLNEFQGRYLLRDPPSSDYPHEDIQLEAATGLRLLGPAPALDVKLGIPPAFTNDPASRNRYLWVIDQRGIPYIIDDRLAVIGSNPPKHTNLTGGGAAYLGGEMWFTSEEALFVSGGSGRYPPTDSRQLEEAVQVFESLGYEVRSFGWDHGGGVARRSWEGPA